MDNGVLLNIRRSVLYTYASPCKVFKSDYTTSAILLLQFNLLALLGLGKYVGALALLTFTITSYF